MRRKVYMAFPSNNPADAKTMIESLEHIEDFMREYQIGVLVYAQWPHTRASVREMEAAFMDHGAGFFKSGFATQSVVKGWDFKKNGSNMSYLYHACFRGVLVEPDDIIIKWDDDFEFKAGTKLYHWSSGDHYTDVVEWMWDNPQCGVVMCTGHLGGAGKGKSIYPRMKSLWATNRGLFYRRIPEMRHPLSPGWSLKMRGPMEETAMVYARIEWGFFGAKSMNCPTIHRALGPKAAKSDVNDPIHSIKWSNMYTTRSIRELYDEPTWDYEQRRLPRGLTRLYLEAGGDPAMLFT